MKSYEWLKLQILFVDKYLVKSYEWLKLGILVVDLDAACSMCNLHSHDLRVPVGSISGFKLCLPQCNVPGILNCMSGRLRGFPSLY